MALEEQRAMRKRTYSYSIRYADFVRHIRVRVRVQAHAHAHAHAQSRRGSAGRGNTWEARRSARSLSTSCSLSSACARADPSCFSSCVTRAERRSRSALRSSSYARQCMRLHCFALHCTEAKIVTDKYAIAVPVINACIYSVYSYKVH